MPYTHRSLSLTEISSNAPPILMDQHISRRTWSSSLSHAGEAAPAREHCRQRYALPGWRTCLTSPRISGTCPPGLQQGGRSRLEQLQTQTKRGHRVNLLCCKQCFRFSNRKLGFCGIPTEMAVVLLWYLQSRTRQQYKQRDHIASN
jgi:hypothetical protein